MIKRPRRHDDRHLDFVRALPCVVCGNDIETEAAHIRYGDRRAAKGNPGMGAKPDDSWTVPLCGRHHREQHAMNEKLFWEEHEIDPLFVALALSNVTGDTESGLMIVSNARVKA